jgi:plastocyanin
VQAGDGQAAGNDPNFVSTADAFYPKHLTIHVGDTVEWIGFFHTVTFGPEAMLAQLEKNLVVPVPQKSGPPMLEFNPKAAFPAGGPTFDGTGFVNSGILTAPPTAKAPPSFKLKFTKAGTFTFDCLLHPGMDMSVTVGM